MMDTNVNRTIAQRLPPTPHTRPADEKTGHTTQPVNWLRLITAALHGSCEPHEPRGWQEGRVLQDWLNAERQLVRASGQS